MQQKTNQQDVDSYILSHINALQEILRRSNYPNFSNFMKLLKSEFLWQSKLTQYLAHNELTPRPIVIDISENNNAEA